MSELEDRLNALLSNPEDMGRIAQMASRLMGQIAPNDPPPGEEKAPPGGGDTAGVMGAVSRIMRGLGDNGGKKQLLSGLSPYLAEKRRRRLEKALKIAAAARLAGVAFSEFGGEDGV